MSRKIQHESRACLPWACIVAPLIAALTRATAAGAQQTQTLAQRGEYLARAGDCVSCHTAKGGAPFAGGLRLATPFGYMLAPNITPDPETGIGRWSGADFYRALYDGVSSTSPRARTSRTRPKRPRGIVAPTWSKDSAIAAIAILRAT